MPRDIKDIIYEKAEERVGSFKSVLYKAIGDFIGDKNSNNKKWMLYQYIKADLDDYTMDKIKESIDSRISDALRAVKVQEVQALFDSMYRAMRTDPTPSVSLEYMRVKIGVAKEYIASNPTESDLNNNIFILSMLSDLVFKYILFRSMTIARIEMEYFPQEGWRSSERKLAATQRGLARVVLSKIAEVYSSNDNHIKIPSDDASRDAINRVSGECAMAKSLFGTPTITQETILKGIDIGPIESDEDIDRTYIYLKQELQWATVFNALEILRDERVYNVMPRADSAMRTGKQEKANQYGIIEQVPLRFGRTHGLTSHQTYYSMYDGAIDEDKLTDDQKELLESDKNLLQLFFVSRAMSIPFSPDIFDQIVQKTVELWEKKEPSAMNIARFLCVRKSLGSTRKSKWQDSHQEVAKAAPFIARAMLAYIAVSAATVNPQIADIADGVSSTELAGTPFIRVVPITLINKDYIPLDDTSGKIYEGDNETEPRKYGRDMLNSYYNGDFNLKRSFAVIMKEQPKVSTPVPGGFGVVPGPVQKKDEVEPKVKPKSPIVEKIEPTSGKDSLLVLLSSLLSNLRMVE